MLDDFVVVVVVVRLAALPSAAAACDLVVTMAADLANEMTGGTE